MRVRNHWKSECAKVSSVSQPCWLTRIFQDKENFWKQGLFEKHFCYNKQTKNLMEKKFGFIHLGTPKTVFLMRNFPIDLHNLGIFPNKQGYSFQFPKKSRGGLFFLPGSWHLLTCFKIFMSPSKKCPWSF